LVFGGVGGPKVKKGDLKAVQVMQLLRVMFKQKLDGELDEDAAVAGPGSDSQQPAGDIDPMDSMDVVVDVVSPAKTKNPK
jgi:hypothetical protein